VGAYGLKIISMGLLNPGDKPMIWRGPMLHSVMQQFLRSVVWGSLDYLIVDLPPGTGDVQLSLIQTVLADRRRSGDDAVRRGAARCAQGRRDVPAGQRGRAWHRRKYGLLRLPALQKRVDIFGQGEGKKLAELYGVPLLGEIEIDPQIRIGGDSGKPVASLGENARARAASTPWARRRRASHRSERRRHRAARRDQLTLPMWGRRPLQRAFEYSSRN